MNPAQLERVLAPRVGKARGVWGIAIALLTHASLAGAAIHAPPPAPAPVPTTEIALLPPAPPPPPPPQAEPEPAPPEPAPAPRRARAPRAAKAPPAEAPARAAQLKTVDEAVKTPQEPVRFVTDPNGTSFGYGTVARGGTADAASQAARPDAAPPEGVPGGKGKAPVLSRPPRLGEADPCRGFFPSRAQVDRGEVTLRVRVERDGAVRSVSVAHETPVGHGFGFAARDCLLSKRFTPALDEAGREVAVVSPVTVRFAR
ncbi:MAG: hypothetical protein ABW252_20030 [Polyangiales bacterium]